MITIANAANPKERPDLKRRWLCILNPEIPDKVMDVANNKMFCMNHPISAPPKPAEQHRLNHYFYLGSHGPEAPAALHETFVPLPECRQSAFGDKRFNFAIFFYDQAQGDGLHPPGRERRRFLSAPRAV
jgi:hypothetical protein